MHRRPQLFHRRVFAVSVVSCNHAIPPACGRAWPADCGRHRFVGAGRRRSAARCGRPGGGGGRSHDFPCVSHGRKLARQLRRARPGRRSRRLFDADRRHRRESAAPSRQHCGRAGRLAAHRAVRGVRARRALLRGQRRSRLLGSDRPNRGRPQRRCRHSRPRSAARDRREGTEDAGRLAWRPLQLSRRRNRADARHARRDRSPNFGRWPAWEQFDLAFVATSEAPRHARNRSCLCRRRRKPSSRSLAVARLSETAAERLSLLSVALGAHRARCRAAAERLACRDANACVRTTLRSRARDRAAVSVLTTRIIATGRGTLERRRRARSRAADGGVETTRPPARVDSGPTPISCAPGVASKRSSTRRGASSGARPVGASEADFRDVSASIDCAARRGSRGSRRCSRTSSRWPGSSPSRCRRSSAAPTGDLKALCGDRPARGVSRRARAAVSAAQLADSAARIRREAALTGDMARAWDASSAAAGALMLDGAGAQRDQESCSGGPSCRSDHAPPDAARSRPRPPRLPPRHRRALRTARRHARRRPDRAAARQHRTHGCARTPDPALVFSRGMSSTTSFTRDSTAPRAPDVLRAGRRSQQAAALDARGGVPDLPFRVRPGLVAEMLRFYDHLRRQSQQVERFEELIEEALGGDADGDRGAERMLRQTRFLARRLSRIRASASQASGGCDEHVLRDTADRRPGDSRRSRHVIVTVADWIADPDGLFVADFDLLARMPGRRDASTSSAPRPCWAPGSTSGFTSWWPGLEEVDGHRDRRREPAASGPCSACPLARRRNSRGSMRRDREEELIAVARRMS